MADRLMECIHAERKACIEQVIKNICEQTADAFGPPTDEELTEARVQLTAALADFDIKRRT